MFRTPWPASPDGTGCSLGAVKIRFSPHAGDTAARCIKVVPQEAPKWRTST
jgi:hypothetical protein